MTTELEQKFFRTFEIEPSCPQGCAQIGLSQNCDECAFYDCPPITDKILLEMICLINKNTKYYNKSTYFKEDYKGLKDEILEQTLYCYKTNCLFNKEKEQFKHQIQQLFKN